MKIVLFEFRKNILKKTVIIPAIILLSINMLVIYVQYRYNNDVFTNDINVYNSSPAEWNYYKELHTRLDGEITEEKQDEVINLYNNLKEKIDSGDYERVYTKSAKTGYVFGDYSLVESNFYLPIKYLVSYSDKNNEIVNRAKENVAFYKQADNHYEIEKNQYIVDKYSNRVIHDFYDTTGWKKLFDYNFSDVVIIILLFFCAFPLFHQERICGMENIILGTKKGRKMYIFGKYISVIAGIIMCTIFVTGMNYLMFHVIYGLEGSGMPIYALESFQYSPYNLTMLQAYLVIGGLKCISLVVVCTFLCFIADISRNTMMSFMIFIGSVVLGLYCSGYICSDSVQRVSLAIVSPFSLFKCSDIFKLLYEINLFGNFELRIYVCVIVQVIWEIILICISYWKYKCFNNKKESSGRRYVYE